jgi:selenocysteine lyase/cysteine desulfurase
VAGVPLDDVAIGSAVSQLLAPIAAALPPGARVVAPDVEFTSNLFPWLAAPDVEQLRERLTPYAAGWYAGEDVHASYYGPPLRLATSARRFDISPAWFSYVGAAPALELIEEIGVAAIQAHNVRLANRFLAGLEQPPGNSAIVTVDVPGAEEKLPGPGRADGGVTADTFDTRRFRIGYRWTSVGFVYETVPYRK